MKNTTAKRRFVIIACMVLLLIALLAMSVSTFAKYITTAEVDSKSATVAKWGFVLDAKYGELGAAQAASTEGEGQLALNSSNTELIPNDSTAALEFSIRGTAEVDAILNFDLAINDIWLTEKATGNTYHPLKWTLEKKDVDYAVVPGLANVPFSAIQTYITTNLNVPENGENIAAGEESGLTGEYRLSYVWAYDNPDPSGIAGLTGNEADTILGTMATLVNENPGEGETVTYVVENDTYEANVKLDIDLSITVEQAPQQ